MTTGIRKLKDVEREHIVAVLELKRGNRTHTARELGIGIRTLQRKLERYGLKNYFPGQEASSEATTEG